MGGLGLAVSENVKNALGMNARMCGFHLTHAFPGDFGKEGKFES